jgi:hypothetical protein
MGMRRLSGASERLPQKSRAWPTKEFSVDNDLDNGYFLPTWRRFDAISLRAPAGLVFTPAQKKVLLKRRKPDSSAGRSGFLFGHAT